MGSGKKLGYELALRWHDETMAVGKQHVMPPITLDNQNIKNVYKFQYLGSYMAKSACKTRKTTAKATKMINVFHRRCLRRILGISWRGHVMNDEVTTRSGQAALHNIIATRRRRFIGHILRLPPTRLASLAIEWRPEDGKRNIGRPKTTWQDTLKEDLEVMGIDGATRRLLPAIVPTGSSTNVRHGTGGTKG